MYVYVVFLYVIIRHSVGEQKGSDRRPAGGAYRIHHFLLSQGLHILAETENFK